MPFVSISAQRTIAYGDNFSDFLSVNGEVDTLYFNAVAGDKITIRTANPSSTFDGKIQVFTPNNVLVTSKSANRVTRIDSLDLSQTGRYKMLISDANNNYSGSYGISLQKLSASSLTPIAYNYNEDFFISNYAEMKAFPFSAQSGDKVSSRICSPSNISLTLQVYNPTGNLIFTKAGTNTVRLDSLVLPTQGIYTILMFNTEGGILTLVWVYPYKELLIRQMLLYLLLHYLLNL